MDIETLIEKSASYRRQILQTIFRTKAGHTGGDLSVIDILNVLYNRIMNITPANFHQHDRDHYIQSKGHCVEALYVVLADKGFFPAEDLAKLGQYNTPYIGHPTRKVHGMEQNTGALGHGLSLACGQALAAQKDNLDLRVFTVLGDGEMAEGSNWEACLFASHYKLDNLCAILDYNKLQITGVNAMVMGLEPLVPKLTAFGWAVQEVDGHDIPALVAALEDLPFEPGKPSFLVAHTVKGKGVSFMENVLKWHHGVPSAEQYVAALAELEGTKQGKYE